jgi:hypothetical protein
VLCQRFQQMGVRLLLLLLPAAAAVALLRVTLPL